MIEPTFELNDLPSGLTESGAHFALMAAEFDRYSKRGMDLAIMAQASIESGEPISAYLFVEMSEMGLLFTEGGTANYSTDRVWIKCGDLSALVSVLSGEMFYANGELVAVKDTK